MQRSKTKPGSMVPDGSAHTIAGSGWQPGIIALLLVTVTALIYSNVLSNDFAYYDDESYITANSHIQNGLSWPGITWAFTSIGYSDNWHPLTWLSHMLDIQLFGLDPAGHHFTSLFFHILATLLLFGFLFYTTRLSWPSTFVAAIFAVHPLHVESVAWVAERKDVLSAVFWFATLWAYAYYTRCPNVKKYLLVLILFALGLMAKPMLVTLPIIVLLLDYWPLDRFTLNRKSWIRLIKEKIPFFLLAGASSVITIVAQHGALGSLQHYSLFIRISNAIIAYCVYLSQAFWPVKLSVVYTYLLPRPVYTIMCLFVLVAVSALVIRFGQKNRFLITGWLWYLLSLVPVIGIVQVGSQAHADRYTYIPLTGISLIFAWGLHTLIKKVPYPKKLLFYVVLSAVFIGMVFKTREQISYWENGLTLFTHAFAVTKGYVDENAYYNFGNLLMEAGRTDEAMFHYRKALGLNPAHSKSHINYALLLARKGQTDEAIAHYLKALEHGTDAEAHNNLANLLAQTGRTEEAAAHFQKALDIRPGYADAHYNFGLMLRNIGRTDQAMTHFQEVLKINPNDAGAHFALGGLQMERGQTGEAIDHFRKVVAIDPNNAAVHNNLGILLTERGRTDEAIAHYRKALEINPDAITPLQNLAFAYAQKGQRSEATSLIQNALASAKSAGNEERVKTIARILEKLNETIKPPRVN